jgi:hypothetical protein
MSRPSHILWTLLILALLAFGMAFDMFWIGWYARPLPTCACWCDEPPVVKVQPVTPDNERVFYERQIKGGAK